MILHQRINDIQLTPGSIGDTGAKGDTGATGATGEQGLQGLAAPTEEVYQAVGFSTALARELGITRPYLYKLAAA